MQPDFCWWCDTPVKVNPPHDYKVMTVYCSHRCFVANWLFVQWIKEALNEAD